MWRAMVGVPALLLAGSAKAPLLRLCLSRCACGLRGSSLVTTTHSATETDQARSAGWRFFATEDPGERRESPLYSRARSKRPVLLEEEEKTQHAELAVAEELEKKTKVSKVKKKTAAATKKKTEKEEKPKGPTKKKELRERLAKRITRSGICSRRDAEKLIAEGKIQVDDVVIREPGVTVRPENVIKLEGRKLPHPPEPTLWLHYKKRGVMVTHKDPEGRVSLFPFLRSMDYPYLVSVGRLDFSSEGLLVLTNNTGVAHYLEKPGTDKSMLRKYKVRVRGQMTETIKKKLAEGPRVMGIDYAPIIVEQKPTRSTSIDPERPRANQWLLVTLSEGKNREIRKVFQHFNLTVTRLLRTHYGPFTLPPRMQPGDTLEIRVKEDLLKKAGEYEWWKW